MDSKKADTCLSGTEKIFRWLVKSSIRTGASGEELRKDSRAAFLKISLHKQSLCRYLRNINRLWAASRFGTPVAQARQANL
jgi:hypothetical protein